LNDFSWQKKSFLLAEEILSPSRRNDFIFDGFRWWKPFLLPGEIPSPSRRNPFS
jgi:hypothetical protein